VRIDTWIKLTLIAGCVTSGWFIAGAPSTALAGKDTGIIFGRLNDKVMGESWKGDGKLVVVIGEDEGNKKDFKMCKNGYVAGEVEAGKIKMDVVRNGKESDKERREAFLNQPVLAVVKDKASYWGNVKIGYDYGSLTFRSEDKVDEAKTALVACLKEMGKDKLADKLQTAPVEKQFIFVDMNKR
jgi:hypothetical protein